ncbi:unnamed protein product, partial [Leptidea sinapis]
MDLSVARHVQDSESSSDDEIVVEYVLNRRPKTFRARIMQLDYWNEVEFFERYRMSKSTVLWIVAEVKDSVERQTNRNHAVSALDQLLLTFSPWLFVYETQLTIMYLLCAAVFLTCLYVCTEIYAWRARKNYAHLPSISSLPIIGHLHRIYGGDGRGEELSSICSLAFLEPDSTSSKATSKLPKILMNGGTLVKELNDLVDKPPSDILTLCALATIKAICQAALGVSITTDTEGGREYYHAFERTLEIFIERGVNVIKKTKENRENMKKSNGGTTKNLADKPGFKSYIDILLDLEETDASFTEERMRGEVNT